MSNENEKPAWAAKLEQSFEDVHSQMDDLLAEGLPEAEKPKKPEKKDPAIEEIEAWAAGKSGTTGGQSSNDLSENPLTLTTADIEKWAENSKPLNTEK